jgi:hypothetical protein
MPLYRRRLLLLHHHCRHHRRISWLRELSPCPSHQDLPRLPRISKDSTANSARWLARTNSLSYSTSAAIDTGLERTIGNASDGNSYRCRITTANCAASTAGARPPSICTSTGTSTEGRPGSWQWVVRHSRFTANCATYRARTSFPTNSI